MKTLIAFSDIHYSPVPEKIKSVAEESDYVVFLGDGCINLGDMLLMKKLTAVKGNCDDVPFPREEVLQVEGVKIFVTHGDRYSVKNDLLHLSLKAKELGANLCLYGHTHNAVIEEFDGVTFVNPGAVQSPFSRAPSYAYIVINKGSVTAKIVDIY